MYLLQLQMGASYLVGRPHQMQCAIHALSLHQHIGVQPVLTLHQASAVTIVSHLKTAQVLLLISTIIFAQTMLAYLREQHIFYAHKILLEDKMTSSLSIQPALVQEKALERYDLQYLASIRHPQIALMSLLIQAIMIASLLMNLT